MTATSLETKTLQALVDEQKTLNGLLLQLLDQEQQQQEERPMRELLEDLLLGREADRELLSLVARQQQQLVEFFQRLEGG